MGQGQVRAMVFSHLFFKGRSILFGRRKAGVAFTHVGVCATFVNTLGAFLIECKLIFSVVVVGLPTLRSVRCLCNVQMRWFDRDRVIYVL